jgi:hypothetical protein
LRAFRRFLWNAVLSLPRIGQTSLFTSSGRFVAPNIAAPA